MAASEATRDHPQTVPVATQHERGVHGRAEQLCIDSVRSCIFEDTHFSPALAQYAPHSLFRSTCILLKVFLLCVCMFCVFHIRWHQVLKV